MWGGLVKFHRGGVVLNNMLCARRWICWVFVPGLIPVFQSSVSPKNWRGGGLCLAECHAVAQIQDYHLVCIWVCLVKFQWGGLVLKSMLCARMWICLILVTWLSLSFKAQCLPQIEGVLCLAGCHIVAQTQGYHLVCIWGSLVRFQGVGLF